jgi:hypothetical protein
MSVLQTYEFFDMCKDGEENLLCSFTLLKQKPILNISQYDSIS